MVQFLSINFLLGFLQFLGFFKSSRFFVSPFIMEFIAAAFRYSWWHVSQSNLHATTIPVSALFKLRELAKLFHSLFVWSAIIRKYPPEHKVE